MRNGSHLFLEVSESKGSKIF